MLAQVQVSSFSLHNALSFSSMTTVPCWFVMRSVMHCNRVVDDSSQLHTRRARAVHGSSHPDNAATHSNTTGATMRMSST